ncbi:hypothetical protein HY632_00105 [Candidatus Uhrbacteria bacterium]|nr:hypothetical protein [Candidatus Uhrbacteria bacterium]
MSYLLALRAIVYHDRRRILWLGVFGAVFALAVTLLLPLRYRATMRVLIIQSTSPTLDAFTAVKSAEKIGKNFGQIIASSSFLDRALQANTKIQASYFPTVERKRRRVWEEMVHASVASETSVMAIAVYHPIPAQAAAIAETVGAVLARDAREYTGSPDVAVKVIDSPIISRFPVRPNIPLQMVLGALLAAGAGTLALAARRRS